MQNNPPSDKEKSRHRVKLVLVKLSHPFVPILVALVFLIIVAVFLRIFSLANPVVPAANSYSSPGGGIRIMPYQPVF